MADEKKGPDRPKVPMEDMPEPNIIKPSGKMISVKAGDYIAYVTNKGGTESCPGGWFKTNAKQPVTPEIPQVGIALDPFTYDQSIGARMHSVRYETYRKYWADPNKPQLASEISQDEELAEILK